MARSSTRRIAWPWTLFTFSDSILDCGRYNEHGVDPGRLLVRNDDALFPEFKGRDLQARGPVRLDHRAVDGATVDDLARQACGLRTVRANLRRVNAIIGTFALRDGRLADLHAHFLRGEPSWFTRTIEPSLIGATEVRRVFLPLV